MHAMLTQPGSPLHQPMKDGSPNAMRADLEDQPGGPKSKKQTDMRLQRVHFPVRSEVFCFLPLCFVGQ